MIHRPLRPDFSLSDLQKLLALMDNVRHRAILYGAPLRPGDPGKDRAAALEGAIDGLAAHLTGDPRYYWTDPFSAGRRAA